MIDPENDPILNASSINSEDYWFLKLNNMNSEATSDKKEDEPKDNNLNLKHE